MRRVACLWFFLGAVCWSANPYANTLVLVSIDGFRWDFLDFPEASQMSAIASRGTRVTKLHTVYPSKTFPAHLSIATGLYPTGHGVVDNRFVAVTGLIAIAWAMAGRTRLGWRARHSGRLSSNKAGAPRRFSGLNPTRPLPEHYLRTIAFKTAASRMARE